jgi:ABC-2 type transport system permease protein
MTTVEQTLFLCARVLRNLSRQPIWIVVMVVQPMFWLLLYSQLFRRVTDLGSFGTSDYVDYLTPGVAVMTAFFSGSWAGMGMIEDLDRGVIERFLATPARRSAIVFGWVLYSGIVATLQALLILLTGLVLGATNGGVVGWLVILLAAFLVAAGFAGLSPGIALLTRQEASMIAIAQFISLPLVFVSSLLIAKALIPGWMQDLSLLNPGRVGDAGRARRGAPWRGLGRDRHLPDPAPRFRRNHRCVRDLVLWRVSARSLDRRSPTQLGHPPPSVRSRRRRRR